MPGENYQLTAPGKLFLFGEYAVVYGSPAVVMSVDKYVKLSKTIIEQPANLISFVRNECEKHLEIPNTYENFEADSSSMFHERTKLGLGSSAVVSALSAASVFHDKSENLEDPEIKKKIWISAKKAHDLFQGIAGSGADIAAAIYGGTIVFNPGKTAEETTITKWNLPISIKAEFLWTGTSASTSNLLKNVKALEESDPKAHQSILNGMKNACEEFINLQQSDSQKLLKLIKKYADLMKKLGNAANCDIITSQMEEIFLLAEKFGGAAKASGAGGGDFVVAFLPIDADFDEFRLKAQSLNAHPIEINESKQGVKITS